MKMLNLDNSFHRLEDRSKEPFRKDEPYTLVHIHIPKCSGMAFQEPLKQHISPCIHLQWDRGGADWREHYKSGEHFFFVTGHIKFDEFFFEPDLYKRQNYAISIVREPLERVVSLYNYGRSENYPDAAAFHDEFPTVNHFLKSLINESNANEQSEWICGNKSDISLLESTINRFYLGIGTPDHAEIYLQKILLSTGCPEVVKMKRLNILQKILFGKKFSTKDLDPELVQHFMDTNKTDYLLYQSVKKYADIYFNTEATNQDRRTRTKA